MSENHTESEDVRVEALDIASTELGGAIVMAACPFGGKVNQIIQLVGYHGFTLRNVTNRTVRGAVVGTLDDGEGHTSKVLREVVLEPQKAERIVFQTMTQANYTTAGRRTVHVKSFGEGDCSSISPGAFQCTLDVKPG